MSRSGKTAKIETQSQPHEISAGEWSLSLSKVRPPFAIHIKELAFAINCDIVFVTKADSRKPRCNLHPVSLEPLEKERKIPPRSPVWWRNPCKIRKDDTNACEFPKPNTSGESPLENFKFLPIPDF
jgi:hypothetical protein